MKLLFVSILFMFFSIPRRYAYYGCIRRAPTELYRSNNWQIPSKSVIIELLYKANGILAESILSLLITHMLQPAHH